MSSILFEFCRTSFSFHDRLYSSLIQRSDAQLCPQYPLVHINESWLLSCFQLEAIVVEMQDAKSGVKGSEQKLNVTTIPHVITGEAETHKHMRKDSKMTEFFKALLHIVFQVNIIGLLKSACYQLQYEAVQMVN